MKARPASVKGQYLKKITVSSTMGPSVLINHLTNQLSYMPSIKILKKSKSYLPV